MKNLITKLLKAKNGNETLRWSMGLFPAGHFYSPIPDRSFIDRNVVKNNETRKNLSAVVVNARNQRDLLEKVSQYYKEQPFTASISTNNRYYFENPSYSYGDGLILYAMIRHFKPKKIIEIGCGYSSQVILDTNELFFKNNIRCEFIDPFPETFLSLVKPGDKKSLLLYKKSLQEIDMQLFAKLERNDFLVIDSTHVSKFGSDVNDIIFNVLPSLNKGVIIHFHDVFSNFEYPSSWIKQGIFWNEAYLLRAFLQYNNAFRIIYHNDFVAKKYGKFIKQAMPLMLKNTGGSIWLKKMHKET